ncbi:MAG: hypothetical protein J0L64_22865 [Acidobacteria bacterium]|nr:hypothetical protein [Acidobacteriota bacterium]
MAAATTRISMVRCSSGLRHFCGTWLFLWAFGMAGDLKAGDINARSEIEAALASAGQVNKSRIVRREVSVCETRTCGSIAHGGDHECLICRNQQFDVEEVISEPLRLVDIHVVQVHDLEYGPAVRNAVPPRVHAKSFKSRNCSSSQQSASTNLTLVISTSESISITRGVTNTGTVSTTVKLFDNGFNLSLARAINLSETNASNETKSTTISDSINRVQPAYTELWGELRVTEERLSIPFKARVVVDGTVDANRNGYSQVSQVLAENQRTFVAEGFIEVSSISGQTSTAIYERALNKEKDCTGQPISSLKQMDSTLLFLGMARPHSSPSSSDSVRDMADEPSVSMDSATFAKLQAATQEGSAKQFVVKKSLVGNTNKKSGDTKGPSIAQATPVFLAGGQHQCQSSTDIGHRCKVSDVGFSDCNEAHFKLQANDCCPSTLVYTPDPQTGTIKPSLGGTSIGFSLQYCVPIGVEALSLLTNVPGPQQSGRSSIR